MSGRHGRKPRPMYDRRSVPARCVRSAGLRVAVERGALGEWRSRTATGHGSYSPAQAETFDERAEAHKSAEAMRAREGQKEASELRCTGRAEVRQEGTREEDHESSQRGAEGK